MNWKTRQLFSNREQGIMSGLDPIPMMGGGSVPYPGMQNGGPVLHTHPELHSHSAPPSGLTPRPEYLADPDMVLFGAPKMQDGGMVGMDLFEEGDQDVNEALNMMATVANPEVPDMPMMEETVEVTETITEDQGPGEYKTEVEMLKDTFKEEIRSYVAQGGTDNLGEYLKNMNITYTNELDNLKTKHGVEMDDPADKLLTSEFIDEIMQIDSIPEMQDGGVVEKIQTKTDLAKYGIQVPIEIWTGMSKEQKEAYLFAAIAEQANKRNTPQTNTSRLDKLLSDRKGLADELGKAAAFKYKTKEGGTGGLIGKLLAQRAGKAEATDKMLADEIAAERAALRSGTSTSGRFDLPADTLNRMILGEDTDMDTSSAYVKLLARAEEESQLGVAQDFAIAALAKDGALPPRAVAPIFHQTIYLDPPINRDVTWPEYFRLSMNQLEQENKKTPSSAEELVAKWRRAVGT